MRAMDPPVTFSRASTSLGTTLLVLATRIPDNGPHPQIPLP